MKNFKVYSVEIKFTSKRLSPNDRHVTSSETWRPKLGRFEKAMTTDAKCKSSPSLGSWAMKKIRLGKKRFTHNWFMTVKTTRGQYIYHNFK